MLKSSGVVLSQHIDKTQANWGQAHIVNTALKDDIDYLRFMPQQEYDFFNFDIKPLALSFEDYYPTRYKVAGYSIFRALNREILERQTYDFLNFLGDVGGLDGVLIIVFYYLTA
jgi:hypothetical protein